MAITVASIFAKARRLLADDGTRWSDNELLDWVNDAQREAVIVKPDVGSKTVAFPCVAGTKQTLPSDATQLIKVTRNLAGDGTPIRFVTTTVLDAEQPQWHTLPGVDTITNYTYNEFQNDVFYVYPPASVGANIEVVYSASPTETTIGGNLSIPDIYAAAVLNYVVFRALSKDADYAQNSELADLYYQRFLHSLGIKQQNEANQAPAVAYNRAPTPQVR